MGPGGVLASQSLGLLEGGAWALPGGAREGGGARGQDSVEKEAVPGSAARGLGPGPARARGLQVSKTRAQVSPSTFLNFLFGPSFRKGPGGREPGPPFPRGGVCARAEAGPQSSRDPAQSNFSRPETFRLWHQVSASLGSPA